MTIVKITDNANQDLLDILTWIAQDSPESALKFVSELQDKTVRILQVLPKGGKPFRDDMRYIVVRNRSVVYKYYEDTDVVMVLNFYNPGQDWI